MSLHNEHVFRHWRWKRWVAIQQRRPMAAFFFEEWAADERNLQNSQ